MAVFQQEVQVKDFSASPASSHIFTLPAGHTLAQIVGVGITAAGNVILRVGDDSTIYGGATDYYAARHGDGSAGVSRTSGATAGVVCTAGTALNGICSVFNMRTAAPVCVMSDSAWGAASERDMRIRRSAAEHTRIQVLDDGANTISVGQVYCISYKRRNTVTTHDFSTGADAKLTGLTKTKSGLLVYCSFDAVSSTTPNVVFSTSIDNGATWQSAAGDYRISNIGANGKDVVFDSTGGIPMGSAGPAASLTSFAIFGGVPEDDMLSAMLDQGEITTASTLAIESETSHRNTAEANDAIRARVNNATGGTGYWVEYKV